MLCVAASPEPGEVGLPFRHWRRGCRLLLGGGSMCHLHFCRYFRFSIVPFTLFFLRFVVIFCSAPCLFAFMHIVCLMCCHYAQELVVETYTWALAYFGFIVAEMVLTKLAITKVRMRIIFMCSFCLGAIVVVESIAVALVKL